MNDAVLQVESEQLPFGINSFDAVISNGVISPLSEKETLFRARKKAEDRPSENRVGPLSPDDQQGSD